MRLKILDVFKIPSVTDLVKVTDFRVHIYLKGYFRQLSSSKTHNSAVKLEVHVITIFQLL